MTFADDFDAFLDSLDGDLPPAERTTTAEKFPCGQCAGTGKYQGARVHQEKAHCFACKGTGYFKTDPRKLKQAAASRKARSEAAADASRAANAATGLIEAFAEINKTGWCTFLNNMMYDHHAGKAWSGHRIDAARGIVQKAMARRAERDAERTKATVAVDLSPIKAMFDAAHESGHKRPTYRAEGVILNRAPDHGANAGALYVKSEGGEYLGKIVGLRFMPTREGMSAADALMAIAADPREAAVRWGRKTGRCSCCGRELSDPASVEAGIGPICAEKWGL